MTGTQIDPNNDASRMAAMMAVLGDDEPAAPSSAPAAPEEPEALRGEVERAIESLPPAGEHAAPVEEQPSGEGKATQEPAPAEPPIEPPLSWSKEWKEKFHSLPREHQQLIADRERERDLEVRRGQNEAAEAKRAAEAERQKAEAERTQAAQERLRQAQALQTFIQNAQVSNPILTEGAQRDWAKFARENPAEAQVKWHEYQQTLATLNQAEQARRQLMDQARSDHLAREDRALIEKIPEWKDPEVGKKGLREIAETLTSRYGFRSEEAVLGDHRQVLVVRDAMRAHQLETENADLKARIGKIEAEQKAAKDAAQKALAEKRVPPAPSKVATPQAAREVDEGKESSDRVKAYRKQVRHNPSERNRMAVIDAALK